MHLRLAKLFRSALLRRLMRIPARRPPDVVIGGEERPYMRRWWLIPRNRWCNVYLHHFLRSDDDRALHDHPWANLSILLSGSYMEHMSADRLALRIEGDLVARGPRAAHRVQLLRDDAGGERAVWTLFVTGPKVREWGFHCPWGWRHWREFTAGPRGERVGKGCE